MSEEKTIRIAHQTVWESVATDTYSLIIIVVVIGLGIFLDSSAMQWIGFLFVVGALCSRFNNKYRGRTPQEAADYLKEKYGVSAK